jgi:hypothetical protein
LNDLYLKTHLYGALHQRAQVLDVLLPQTTAKTYQGLGRGPLTMSLKEATRGSRFGGGGVSSTKLRADSGSSAGMGRQSDTDRGLFVRMCSQIIKKRKLTG